LTGPLSKTRTSVKSCIPENEAAQQQFLTQLSTTVAHASPLPLHFSVSWNWWCCDCGADVERLVTWNGEEKKALADMIDLVYSVDVQVAWNVGSTMIDRAQNPYDYLDVTKQGQTSTTAFYVLAHTNPNTVRRLSFSPRTEGATVAEDTCSTGDRTEAGMFFPLDAIMTALPNADGGIHFVGGVFLTGMPCWPEHAPEAPTPSDNCPTILPPAACSFWLMFLAFLGGFCMF